MAERTTMALEGIRVIDWTVLHVGPYATKLLSDLGAEVIHVEDPGGGDLVRGIETVWGRSAILPSGLHIHFEEMNINKKGIVLNLGVEKGREVIYRLVEKSDVFVTNFRLKAVAKLGMDYDTLRRHNPRLIYASATGFGHRGPDADRASLDYLGMARGGLMWASGEEGMPPVDVVPGIGDRIAAITLSYGILTALLARERLGIGQEVRTSMLSSMMMLLGWTLASTLAWGQDFPRARRNKALNPIYNHYKCQDGNWICLGMFQPDRYWGRFCQAVGLETLEGDPKFSDAKARAENCEQLVSILDELFATRPYHEWEGVLKQGDFLFCKVSRLSDLASDPQVVANHYVIEYDHPVAGRIKWPGFSFELGETPPRFTRPAPEYGQHTEEILSDVCGYTWAEIAQLRDQGITGG